jgi:hypothetical protein
VRIKGSSGEPNAGGEAVGTSWAGLKVGCGTNLTTSVLGGGACANCGAGLGTLVATGLDGVGAESGLAALATRDPFVAMGFGGLTLATD